MTVKKLKQCELEVEVEEIQEVCTMEIVNSVWLFKCDWCSESLKSVDDLKKNFNKKH